MKYASIDIETTDLDPQKGQILEIAAVVDDLDGWSDNVPRPAIRLYLAHKEIHGSPTALAMNADIIKIIAENKHPDLQPPLEAEWKLFNFLSTHLGKNEKWNVAGKNFNGFDKNFMIHQFHDYAMFKHKFHHRTIDPATHFRHKGDKNLPDLKTCLERANIKNTRIRLNGYYDDDQPRTLNLHQALDDATAVLLLVRHAEHNQ